MWRGLFLVLMVVLVAGVLGLQSKVVGIQAQSEYQEQVTSSPGGNATPAATLPTNIPVVTGTPDADGKLFHIVQSGQVLWNIALAYKISLAELMALNGFT